MRSLEERDLLSGNGGAHLAKQVALLMAEADSEGTFVHIQPTTDGAIIVTGLPRNSAVLLLASAVWSLRGADEGETDSYIGKAMMALVEAVAMFAKETDANPKAVTKLLRQRLRDTPSPLQPIRLEVLYEGE